MIGMMTGVMMGGVMSRLCKLIAALALAVGVAWADVLDEKIQELIGAPAYTQNKNFINSIFASRSRFYTDKGALNVGAIAYALKNNGLLMLKFPSPMELRVTFESKSSLQALSYTLNTLLSSMGYSYFMLSQASKAQDLSSISYALVTEHALDPIILFQELEKRGFWLQDMKRKAINDWSYTIQAQNIRISNARAVSAGEPLSLREVSGQYWLSLPKGGMLKISANPKWIPRVICYDKNLQIVQTIIEREPREMYAMRLDSASAFVMITDAENPNIIKQIEVSFTP